MSMPELASIELTDRLAREEALDTGKSILVQAPAGSGKTELLAMRYLKLLAEVEAPGEILAITFTMNATAEMRHRVLAKLEAAKRFLESGSVPDGENLADLQIAAAAYTHSITQGWRLLERPQSLNIQSIDSLNLRIAHQFPLTIEPGGTLGPTTVSGPLYRQAASRTLDRLGGEDEELNTALRELLLLRDSNLAGCEGLLAGMLATRDQWVPVFPLAGDIDWERTRERLEAPFTREIDRVLGKAHALLTANPVHAQELLELAGYACRNLEAEGKTSPLAGFVTLPSPSMESLGCWVCLCEALLTRAHRPRKAYTAGHGFPRRANEMKARMLALVQALDNMGFMDLLRVIRELPPPTYTEKQWRSLRHIFVALRRAVYELDAVFAEKAAVDFIEIGMAALEALRGDAANLAFISGIRHLLVDEFQDTSRRQHELLAALLRGWSADAVTERPPTLFLVGDPMQSIYMFRQAEVELFDLVRRNGFAASNGPLRLKNLRLATNFRSIAGVVKPLNTMFEVVFPHRRREGSASVDFLPGVPSDTAAPKGAFEVHVAFAERNKSAAQEPSHAAADEKETEEVLRVVRRHWRRIYRARLQGKEFTVAVLARAKNHLVPIAAALRREGIPFRGVELETLGERQEILDLQALTRALLHPMDRIAWLTLLRAPWCGLELRDLHLLCGTDGDQFAGGAVSRQIDERLSLLSNEPRARVNRVISILRGAAHHRHRQSSFSSWIERTWNSLGGPACVDAAGNENARAYFRMLEQVSSDGIAATGEAMEQQLDRLFASPDPSVGERCGVQLMTMHKAKGLGFNVVLLPGLHRITRAHAPALIRYLERATEAGPELLVAPIDEAGDETSLLTAWVRRQKENREVEERKRLLYVACTRAREELHLFATAAVTDTGLTCKSGSLLRTAWPALQKHFERRYAEAASARPASGLLDFPAAPPQDLPFGGILDTVAAEGRGSILRRLPSGWSPEQVLPNVSWSSQRAALAPVHIQDERGRPQGSHSSRILGTTVHILFDRAARLLARGCCAADLRGALPEFRLQANALTRNGGLSPQEAAAIANSAVQALEKTLSDPIGLWILGPHRESQTESSWTGMIEGVSRTLRIDRSFFAGVEPFLDDQSCLWIIDYKTANHGPSGIERFLDAGKLQYAAQLESYAEILRLAHGSETQLRVGLYYPFLPRLVWWEA
jgi:ATP-dependent helicase/nuclease subunit A